MWLGITALSTVLAIYNILFGIRIWREYLVLVCYVLEMSHDRSWVSNLSKVYYGRMSLTKIWKDGDEGNSTGKQVTTGT